MSAFESDLGVYLFGFTCDSDNNLYTISICLNATSYDPIDCPSIVT